MSKTVDYKQVFCSIETHNVKIKNAIANNNRFNALETFPALLRLGIFFLLFYISCKCRKKKT